MTNQSRKIIALYRPDHVSGINATARRMAMLPEPWLPMICGPGLDPRATSMPGFGPLPVTVATWPEGADPVEQALAVYGALREASATIVVPNDIPHGFVAAGIGAHEGLRAAAWIHADGLDADELVERCGGLASAWRGVSGSNVRRAASIGTLARGGASEPVPCPVDVCDEAPGVPDAAGGRPIRLLYAGRLERFNKRVLDLVALCDALVARGVSFHLSIAGRGPAEGELREAMSRHVRAGRVLLLGAVDNDRMRELYGASDALVLVSGSEGTPVVAMEAMASARAVIATDRCGGVLETIRAHTCGTITPVGDMHAMALAIGGLSLATLRAMGERAFRAARERYSVEALSPAIARWMDEATNAAPIVDTSDPSSVARHWAMILRALGAIGPCAEGSLRRLATRYLGAIGRPQMAGALATWLPAETGPRERHFLRALDLIVSRGARRVALYGAGAHTARLSRAIGTRKEIVAIADDRAGERGVAASIGGAPVVAPVALQALGVDAVLISSDEHERTMLGRALAWRAAGVTGAAIFPMYLASPTIGHSATRETIAQAPADEREFIAFEGAGLQATRRAG